MKVGFIGLGIMGSAMAMNLYRRGFLYAVYNRTRSKAAPFESLNVKVAENPKELAELSDVVITMVTDGPDTEQVLFGKNGVSESAIKGLTVIDMGTNSPAYARSFADRLEKLGMDFLDAPVTGGDVGARQGTLTIMVGGKEEVFERVRPVFEAMGKLIIYAGPVGYGQRMKLVNQVAVALSDIAMVEAMVMAERLGLDMEKVYQVLSTGGARSFSIESYMPRLLKGDLEPGFRISHLRKDLWYALEEAKKEGVALPATSMAFELFLSSENLGYGEKGIQALIKLYEKISGVKLK
ncbi:MAG: NAD(P)-dependent oxidoreductase [Nitrososphaeria archaeon]